jgi:hypothetical protein
VCDLDSGETMAFLAENTHLLDYQKPTRMLDVTTMKDVKTMFREIGETFDPLNKFKSQNSMAREVNPRCFDYPRLNRQAWANIVSENIDDYGDFLSYVSPPVESSFLVEDIEFEE